MRKSPCHPDHDLVLRRMGKRAGADIYLTSCPECGRKYQVTPEGKIYQTKKRSTQPTKSVPFTGRATEERMAWILKHYRSKQNFIDNAK